jgi:hypothetical protein
MIGLRIATAGTYRWTLLRLKFGLAALTEALPEY